MEGGAIYYLLCGCCDWWFGYIQYHTLQLTGKFNREDQSSTFFWNYTESEYFVKGKTLIKFQRMVKGFASDNIISRQTTVLLAREHNNYATTRLLFPHTIIYIQTDIIANYQYCVSQNAIVDRLPNSKVASRIGKSIRKRQNYALSEKARSLLHC